jgi:hypothetical protein
MFKNVLFQMDANEYKRNITAQQVLVGDFNGDGIQDLAVPFVVGSGGVGDPIRFYLGNGDGTFTEATKALFGDNPPYPVYPARIVGGDFNRDGRTDVLVPDSGIDRPPFPGGQSGVILSNPDGTMRYATDVMPQQLVFTHGAIAGDIDGDGNLDAILVNLNVTNGEAIQILLGDGKGDFVERLDLAPAMYQGAGWNGGNTWGELVDVNHDGAVDLIVGPEYSADVPGYVFLNNGKGDFSRAAPISLPLPEVPTPHTPYIESADFNGDGHADLIFSLVEASWDSPRMYNTPNLQILIGDGTGHFRDETAERIPSPLSPSKGWIKFIQSADVNHDGSDDLIAFWDLKEAPWIETRIFLNDGFGHFAQLDAPVAGTTTALVDAQNRVTSFASVRFENEYQGQGLFITANDAIGLPAPVLRVPVLSSLPGMVVHRFFNSDHSPTAEKLSALSDFAFTQYRYYDDMGVARPEIGPYEALGRAFAETAGYQELYGGLARAAFVSQAYEDVFERPATAAQIGHFMSQIAYFVGLYEGVGMPDASADLAARGAVVGQMLGYAAFDENGSHLYIEQARGALGLSTWLT